MKGSPLSIRCPACRTHGAKPTGSVRPKRIKRHGRASGADHNHQTEMLCSCGHRWWSSWSGVTHRDVPDWKICKHDFPNYHEPVAEPDFGVVFGCKRVCKKCGAIEYENYCETRASGGVPRIYPPNDDKPTKTPTKRRKVRKAGDA